MHGARCTVLLAASAPIALVCFRVLLLLLLLLLLFAHGDAAAIPCCGILLAVAAAVFPLVPCKVFSDPTWDDVGSSAFDRYHLDP